MRDVYYRIESLRDAPVNGALVRIWRDTGTLKALWTISGVTEADRPDIALFCATLARVQLDLIGVFVWLADDNLWQSEWGELRGDPVRIAA